MKHPSMFAIHIWGNLHQSARVEIPVNATAKQLDKLLKERHERGLYIDQLTHYGPHGSFGFVNYINSLPGN